MKKPMIPGDTNNTGNGTRILGGIEYAIPGSGTACEAANDCCRVRGHTGVHINSNGFKWGDGDTSKGESWIDIFDPNELGDWDGDLGP